MSKEKYKAFIVREEDGRYKGEIGNRSIDDLPEGDLLISVKYSSLNYKDALSAAGNKGVTKNYPHVPGIDAAGVVVESSSAKFKTGDEILVTGYDLGMNTSGGFQEYISIPSEWGVKLPDKLNLKESMILGTAGFTAALSLFKLEHNGISPSQGKVLVTGSTGGVGSLAVAILSAAGYTITAVTGKKEKTDYLRVLGASEIISREEAEDNSGRPLLKGRWQAVIDTVGGKILSSAIASTKQHGSVASCGLVQSPNINTTVFPFILRGINLLGIDSAEIEMNIRKIVWHKLSNEWKPETLNLIAEECRLENLNEKIDLILKGQLTGRTVVSI